MGIRLLLDTQPASPWQYNHPPLMGYWALASGKLSGFDAAGFARFLKLRGLFAEVFSAGLIYHIWSRRDAVRAPRAFAVYGLSLPLLLVSGYHCNTEPLYTAFGLLIMRREEAAATRLLASSARVMAEQPLLLRLKELETLKEMAERIDEVHLVVAEGGLGKLLPAQLFGEHA